MSDLEFKEYVVREIKDMKKAQEEHLGRVDEKIEKTLAAGEKKQSRFYVVVGILAFIFVGMFSFVGVKAIQFAGDESAHGQEITTIKETTKEEFVKVYAAIDKNKDDAQKQLNQLTSRPSLSSKGITVK